MDKIKVYLDTNTIIDFFINQAKAIRSGESFKMPKKLEFFIDNLDKMDFETSIITKGEIIREMVAGYQLSEKDIIDLWDEFIETLNCKFIPKIEIDERFAEVPLKIKLKLRTLMNFQHLFIAMEEDAYLVSGDSDLINVVRENKIYDKILSYIELRKLIASFSQGL